MHALRLAVVAMVAFVLATGTSRTLLVQLLTPEREHVCACSLEAGHKCRCLKCLGDAHASHDEPDRPAIDDEACGDEASGGLAQWIPGLAIEPLADARRSRHPVPDRVDHRVPLEPSSPEPPPPIGVAHVAPA